MFETDKSKLIDTPTFQLKDNTLWFKNYFLQVSNISQVSAQQVEAKSYTREIVVTFFVGLALIWTKVYLLGILAWMVMGYLLLLVYRQKQKEPEYFVFIYLNSGNRYCFRCVSQEFANRVMEALRECINMPHSQITVDFANSKISNSPITFGNENHVTR